MNPPNPPFLDRKRLDELLSKQAPDRVDVSVICFTYNHVNFVEDALLGILSQETRFLFEIIVRDDASTDGTRDIIQTYANRFPSLIVPILEKSNTWGRVQPGAVCRPLVRGKYVAYCEGDDYWIDSGKLQKQFDYLETHPEVSICGTAALDIEGNYIIGKSVDGGTRTYMHRASIQIPAKYENRCYFGDTLLMAIMLEHGRLHLLPEVTAVWRKHSGGVFGGLIDNDTQTLNFHRATTQYWISRFFEENGNAFKSRSAAYQAQKFLYLAGAKRLPISMLSPLFILPFLLNDIFNRLFRKFKKGTK